MLDRLSWGEVSPLNELYRQYRDKGFEFFTIYVREPHPGENYGPHQSFEHSALAGTVTMELPRRFVGGFMMGAGGTLAAGCNIGNALTGLSVLSVNSVVATGSMIGGLALAAHVQEKGSG